MGPVRLTGCGGGRHRPGSSGGAKAAGWRAWRPGRAQLWCHGPRGATAGSRAAVRGLDFSVLPASSRNPKVGKVLIPQVNGNRKVKMKVSDA